MTDSAAARAARLLHHRKSGLMPGDPIAAPIVPASTFHLPANGTGAYNYSRANGACPPTSGCVFLNR